MTMTLAGADCVGCMAMPLLHSRGSVVARGLSGPYNNRGQSKESKQNRLELRTSHLPIGMQAAASRLRAARNETELYRRQEKPLSLETPIPLILMIKEILHGHVPKPEDHTVDDGKLA